MEIMMVAQNWYVTGCLQRVVREASSSSSRTRLYSVCRFQPWLSLGQVALRCHQLSFVVSCLRQRKAPQEKNRLLINHDRSELFLFIPKVDDTYNVVCCYDTKVFYPLESLQCVTLKEGSLAFVRINYLNCLSIVSWRGLYIIPSECVDGMKSVITLFHI